jgi:hypothetical protein
MTQEEKKQELIIRQSQVSATINYFTLIGKKPSMVDIIKVSTMMEQFIVKGYSTEMVELMSKVDKYISEEMK